ncbi:hypothetical protein G6011_09903 [Alternaria panax]|uniref:Uncharacterized protein n=1 Tax=Alternaria panax TaxID=48097 RepID=A0AAD4I2S7_9PLEO|nr:hypothetical protein G6011_09903 [Alternaria panax]
MTDLQGHIEGFEMADLPEHIEGYGIVDSLTVEPPTADSYTKDTTSPDTDMESLPPLPPSPTLQESTQSRRRTSSPPAPTIYLTGFRCHAADPEYAYAKDKTEDDQPYWFEQAYGAADFNEGVRRRAIRDMPPQQDEVAIIDLDDAGNELSRGTAREQRERTSERILKREQPEWMFGGDEDISRIATEEEGLSQRILTRGEEWKQIEAETERLLIERKEIKAAEKEQKQREKDERHAHRAPIRDRALSLLGFQAKLRQKVKSKPETTKPVDPEAEAQKAHPSLSAVEDRTQLPAQSNHAPLPPALTICNPDPQEATPQPPSTPPRGRAPTRPRATTPPSLKSLTTTATEIDTRSASTALISPGPSSSSATQVQIDVPLVPMPENSGLVRGVGTLERQIPENSGLVQDFGTLERARSLKAKSGGWFGCCLGMRK